MRRHHAILLAIALGSATPAHSQSATRKDTTSRSGQHGRILGVFDAESGAPVEGADVIDLFVDEAYRTGPSGLVGLWALQHRNDSAAVRIRKIGYGDTAFVVMVGARDTAPISIFLKKVATLPTVETRDLGIRALTPNLAEFESRRNDKSLTGRFLTQADLEKHSSQAIFDVLYNLMAGKSRGCNVPPKMFIDGIRQSDPADTSGKTADDYEGIEFYTPGAAPLRFGGTFDAIPMHTGVMAAPTSGAASVGTVAGAAGPQGSASGIRAASPCGVFVLWRRERP